MATRPTSRCSHSEPCATKCVCLRATSFLTGACTRTLLLYVLGNAYTHVYSTRSAHPLRARAAQMRSEYSIAATPRKIRELRWQTTPGPAIILSLHFACGFLPFVYGIHFPITHKTQPAHHSTTFPTMAASQGIAKALPKVTKSAIVIMPPQSTWDPIQDIRKVHDRAYARWMPHINLYAAHLACEIHSNTPLMLLQYLSFRACLQLS